MATLIAQPIVPAGLAPSYTAASAVSDTFANDGAQRLLLHVINANGAGARVVTIAKDVATTAKPGFGTLVVADMVISIPLSDEKFIGPIELTAYGANPVITTDDESDVTMALPRIG